MDHAHRLTSRGRASLKVFITLGLVIFGILATTSTADALGGRSYTRLDNSSCGFYAFSEVNGRAGTNWEFGNCAGQYGVQGRAASGTLQNRVNSASSGPRTTVVANYGIRLSNALHFPCLSCSGYQT